MSKATHTDPVVASPEQPSSINSFAGKDREALVSDIVKEMRKDSVKEEASAKLKKGDWLQALSKFFQHPAVLLILGFTITGWIGAKLANNWQSQEWNRQQGVQSKEWERQQQRLVKIRDTDLKY